MNGYDFYCTFQAVKLHFTSEKYNFFQYDGKTRVSVDAFQKRRDKFLFHRLARKYNEQELVPFLVSNFVYSGVSWAKNLLEEGAHENYLKWRRVTDSMSQVYTEDLQKIATKENFNDLFKVIDGQHPILLQKYLQKEVHIESLVILNNIFGFLKIWDKKIEDDIIYPKIALKIRKYGAFLSMDTEKYKNLTKEVLL
jgi:hypothetical protein